MTILLNTILVNTSRSVGNLSFFFASSLMLSLMLSDFIYLFIVWRIGSSTFMKVTSCTVELLLVMIRVSHRILIMFACSASISLMELDYSCCVNGSESFPMTYNRSSVSKTRITKFLRNRVYCFMWSSTCLIAN